MNILWIPSALRRTLPPLLLAVGVGLLVPALAAGADDLHRSPEAAPGEQGRLNRPDPEQRSLLRLSDQLGLTEEQQARIKSLEDETRQKVQGLREQLRSRAQTLRQDNPDLGRQDLASDPEIASLREQMRSAHDALRAQLKTILTEEQQEKLREIVRQRREERGGPGRFGAGRGLPGRRF